MKIISYKKDGKTFYKFRVLIGTDLETGKQIRVHRSGFFTKLEAEKEYIKLKGSKPRKSDNTTFEIAFYNFLNIKKIACKESHVLKLERTYINHFKEPLGSKLITEITISDLQKIMLNLYNSISTANKVFSLIEQVFKQAYKQRLIEENPCDFLTKPKISKKSPSDNFYDKNELKDFLEKAERDLSHMWYVFFHLLAYSGIRRGEALALYWNDLKGDILSINKTLSNTSNGMAVSNTPKTAKSNREILLDKVTVDLLNSLEHSSDFIFSNTKGSFITPSQPVRQLHKVKEVRYISPHGFRHTHCSLLFSAGVSIPEAQQRMGHEDVKTTLQIYNHVFKEDQERALKNFINFMKK